jgi:hypothetical protein
MAGYEPKITPITFSNKSYVENLKGFGGWDPESKTFKKLKFAKLYEAYQVDGNNCAVSYALDSLTLAVESGQLDGETLLKQVAKKDLEALVEALSDYDDWWVNERHFNAMAELAGFDEGGMTTYSGIAQCLADEFLG